MSVKSGFVVTVRLRRKPVRGCSTQSCFVIRGAFRSWRADAAAIISVFYAWRKMHSVIWVFQQGGEMYRRLIGTELWHSSPNCTFWPNANYDEMEYPSIGKLCPACEQRETAQDRRSVESENSNKAK